MKSKMIVVLGMGLAVGTARASVNVMDSLLNTSVLQFHSDPSRLTAPPNRYEELEDHYSRGTAPQASDLTGWLSGRCFDNTRKDLAKNGLLDGFFDASGTFKFLAIQYDDGTQDGDGMPPNYFDVLDQEKIDETNQFLQGERGEVTATPTLLENNALYGGIFGQHQWSLRKFDSDIVLRWGSDDYVIGYCRYFLKVK